MTSHRRALPALPDLKRQARALRASLARREAEISHSRALELIARQYGYADWNTLYAAVGNGPPAAAFTVGQAVSGRYLGQPFDGEIIGVRKMAGGDRYQLTIRFEEPVDVVAFEGFSNFRRRISCVVDRAGRSFSTTSNGARHVTLAARP